MAPLHPQLATVLCSILLMTMLHPAAARTNLARTGLPIAARRLPAPPWAAGFTDGAVIQRMVDGAIAAGATSLALPPGNFTFRSAPFVVASATGLKVRLASECTHSHSHTSWAMSCCSL
jgi:hypothetical protein